MISAFAAEIHARSIRAMSPPPSKEWPINSEYENASKQAATVAPEVDALVRLAITRKRLIKFSLQGHARLAEPHDYGIRGGVPQLLAYQIGGSSKSGKLPDWRWVVLSEVSDLRVLDDSFPGGRRAVYGKHNQWERLFLRVTAPDDSSS
jgi:hypothetical protein